MIFFSVLLQDLNLCTSNVEIYLSYTSNIVQNKIITNMFLQKWKFLRFFIHIRFHQNSKFTILTNKKFHEFRHGNFLM